MKKIGILTSTPSFNENYGAILQAFALQQKLVKEGFDPCDILYRGDNEPVLNKKANPIARFKGIFLSGDSLTRVLRVITSKKNRMRRTQRFARFQKDHLRLSSESVDYEGLCNLVDSYDAFICGSDQVWNPRVHGGVNDPGYFLQFTKGRSRSISYAPSFGVSVLPAECQESLGEFISNIDYVSVREDSGAKLLSEYAGVDVPVVVDPTLLLSANDYNKVAVRPDWLPQKYIAVYKFGERSEYDKLIRKTAKQLGLEIVNIPAAVDPAFKTRWDIGPAEFLGIIRGAELVCTDSFHATVFSVIYRVPCIVFPRDMPGSQKSMNSRMEGLLDRLGMRSRYAGGYSDWDAALAAPQDYDEAHRRLSVWRGESEDYLARALQGVGE